MTYVALTEGRRAVLCREKKTVTDAISLRQQNSIWKITKRLNEYWTQKVLKATGRRIILLRSERKGFEESGGRLHIITKDTREEKMKDSIIRLYILANSIVQMLMTVGITFASVHFDRISVLWFYLIPAILMNGKFQSKVGDSNE